jgi:hypothetical protein
MAPSESGIAPVSRLPWRSRLTRLLRLPSAAGIDPFSSFPYSSLQKSKSIFSDMACELSESLVQVLTGTEGNSVLPAVESEDLIDLLTPNPCTRNKYSVL